MKKISVIVPVYNAEKYIEKCFNSLIKQTYRDFVVIVINDGSTDNSLEIINEYAQKYDGLFQVYSISNSGRANARNKGMSYVKTEYFTFLDSDDYLDEETLLSFIREADNHTDVVVCDAVRVINNQETTTLKLYRDDIKDKNKALILSSPGPCGKLYRTSVFRDNNLSFPQNIKLYEDLGVIPLVGLYAKGIKYIQEPLYKYVIHEDSAMRQTKFNKQMNDIFTIMKILDKSFNNKYHEELEYLYIENLLRSASLRYVEYQEGYQYLKQIKQIMYVKFPNYQNNKYYQRANCRFKLVCFLAYHGNIVFLRVLNNLNKKHRGL